AAPGAVRSTRCGTRPAAYGRGRHPFVTPALRTSAAIFASQRDMTRTSILIVIGVIAVTVSLAAYYGGAVDGGSPGFATSPVTRGSVVAAIDATGSLEAVETVEVSTQVSGTVESLHADFNSTVKAGDVVARLEPSLLEAQVQQAEASL